MARVASGDSGRVVVSKRGAAGATGRRFGTEANIGTTGAWFVSFTYVDRGGEFAWPDPDSDEFGNLAYFVARANRESLDDLHRVERRTGRPAHCRVDAPLQAEAEVRRQELLAAGGHRAQILEEGELFRFTYCLESGRPERIYGLIVGDHIYLLWWDQWHRVTQIGRPRPVAPCAAAMLPCHHRPEAL